MSQFSNATSATGGGGASYPGVVSDGSNGLTVAGNVASATVSTSGNVTIGGNAIMTGDVTFPNGKGLVTQDGNDRFATFYGDAFGNQTQWDALFAGVNAQGFQFGLNGQNFKFVRGGRATLVAGTVTVMDNKVTTNTLFGFLASTPGGTQGILSVQNIVANTSFDIVSTSALETSVVDYTMFDKS